jgi:hypothetical protein
MKPVVLPWNPSDPVQFSTSSCLEATRRAGYILWTPGIKSILLRYLGKFPSILGLDKIHIKEEITT